MPIVVNVLSKVDYAAWVEAQSGGPVVEPAIAMAETSSEAAPPVAAEDLNGEDLYNISCSACHQANGQGLPPAFPSLVESTVVGGPVADHINVVMNGRPGTAMVAFSSQLSDAEIAAIISYERNAWGRNSGDVVTASDIAAAR